MSRLRVRLLLALLAPLAATGCNPVSMATTAIKEIRGAQGKVILLSDLPRGALDAYSSVRFEPASSMTGPKVIPPSLPAKFDESALKDSTEMLKDSFPGGPPVLSIHTDMIYFQKKGLFSGGEFIARVHGRGDAGTVFDALVRTESAAFTAGGESAMAQASVRAIAKFLENRRQKKENADDDD